MAASFFLFTLFLPIFSSSSSSLHSNRESIHPYILLLLLFIKSNHHSKKQESHIESLSRIKKNARFFFVSNRYSYRVCVLVCVEDVYYLSKKQKKKFRTVLYRKDSNRFTLQNRVHQQVQANEMNE